MKTIVFAFLLFLSSAFNLQPNHVSQSLNYLPNYFLNSSSIAVNNDRQNLYNWINYGNPRTHLLWKGSERKFNWTDMHNKVDNWGALLVLIKTKQGFTFGGYISQGLDMNTKPNTYQRDPKAFIFSLTKETIHYQRNKTAPVIYNSDQYISFGHRKEGMSNWDDISLRYSCNIDYWSYSDFGWAFIPPEGMTPGSSEAQKYMAGQYRWMCSEIEIWAVIDA